MEWESFFLIVAYLYIFGTPFSTYIDFYITCFSYYFSVGETNKDTVNNNNLQNILDSHTTMLTDKKFCADLATTTDKITFTDSQKSGKDKTISDHQDDDDSDKTDDEYDDVNDDINGNDNDDDDVYYDENYGDYDEIEEYYDARHSLYV